MSTFHGNMVGVDFAEKKTRESDPSRSTGTQNRYAHYANAPEHRITSEFRNDTTQPRPAAAETASVAKKGITPLKMFGAFILLTALMIVWIWQAAKVREEMIFLEKLKDQKLEIEKTNESIRVDITRLSNYDRISKIAREQLKMIPATEKPGVIFVDPEKEKVIPEPVSKQHE